MTVLSDADRDLWRGFRRSYEQVSLAIERELVARTGLSGADHGILSRLAGAGPDGLRQQLLADTMRWDRTRLSHHLTRMEERGLVTRSRLQGTGTLVAATARGEQAREAADPVYAEAVTRCFLSGLTAQQREALTSLAASLPAGCGKDA